MKQGPQVREGLVVASVDECRYDQKALGRTVAELSKSTQFTEGVVVQRARILRTRAKFDSWSVVFTIDVDGGLVGREQVLTWLDIGGRRIGLATGGLRNQARMGASTQHVWRSGPNGGSDGIGPPSCPSVNLLLGG